MKKYISILVLTIMTLNAQAQEKPKLVVGIMVDQMRQEYLYRFATKFGNGGFKRLMNDGFMLKNAHYNYAFTFTGPGHASVYTGTTPAIHGIIGNDWYDKQSKRDVNCVGDPNHKSVGVEGKSGISPSRMISSTITDELKLFTQKRSKVIGMSLKDRGAVLPAGHLADGAYWFDGKSGKFVTSTFYTSKLPDWVDSFNQQNLLDKLFATEWKTFYPMEQYTESGPDDSPYESKLPGKERPTFPYNFKELGSKKGGYQIFDCSPFANDYLTEFAKASLANEKLGEDDITDFLALSYSTTDILGHGVGPNSIELEDLYIRLDKNVEDLLKTLDAKIGKGNYTVFLTSDHAVADVAQYLKDSRMPAGYFSFSNTKAKLNEYLEKYFPGKQLIESVDDCQIYFNDEVFQSDPKSSGIELMIATELVLKYVLSIEGVATVYSERMIREGNFGEQGVKGMVIRGCNTKRSGDIVFVLEPGWYNSNTVQGTTHGSPYTYDTHVPVLFFGKGIKKGNSVKYHPITDIAPTLSVLLNIKFPSGCTGQPIEELFE
jgi:predicted AlkP superfamily pyrophosphatase or phosphodiesterase